MHKPRRKHRRATTSNFLDSSSTSHTSTSASFVTSSSSDTTRFSRSTAAFTASTTSFDGSSGAPGTATSSSNFVSDSFSVALSPSSSSTPTTSPAQPFTSQASSTDLTTAAPSTTVATSTVYLSPRPTIVNSQLPEVSSSPTPSSSFVTPPLSLASRDGIIILSLSILAGILSILCVFILWHRCRQRDSHEALENRVDPISFYQSNRLVSRRRTHGNTDSLSRLANLSLDTTSPAEIKHVLRERNSPSHRFSQDSESVPSPPITPTQNQSRCSPALDVLDTRWPGRLLSLMQPQRASGLTSDGSQVIIISGDLSHQSDQSDAGSGTRSEGISAMTPNLPPSGPDNGQALDGMSPVATDATQTKSELEDSARQRQAGQTGMGTWDEPPPEESDKAESAKTGPPAYSPGVDTQSTPPLPMPLPFPPGGPRPLPVPSSGTGGSSRRLLSGMQ